MFIDPEGPEAQQSQSKCFVRKFKIYEGAND